MSEAHGPLSRGLIGCAAAVGQEVKGALRPDTPIKASQLQPPTLVRRGDRVKIIFDSGTLRITAEGEATKDGARGEWIPVLNLGSKRVIKKTEDGVEERSVIPVRFVPMTGEIERQGDQ